MKKDSLNIYQTNNGALELRDYVNAVTIWAMQKQIAELFQLK
jgi:hypothetical protein